MFFTCLWSVYKPLLFDTQNPKMSRFSTAHAHKYKTKQQATMKERQRKMTFLLISQELEKQKFAHRSKRVKKIET